ncbi:MAG: hypothetical protein P9L96_03100 [Candidatus Gygaella obscura]|nr:hypothetical protein [Candidatus Gygaella obscura]
MQTKRIAKFYPLILFILFLSVYLTTFTQTHRCFNQDGLENMQFISSEDFQIFNARDIGYRITGRFIYDVFKLLGWQGSAMIPLQSLSAFFGAIAVVCIYLIIFKIINNYSLAFIISLFFGFSHSFWFFSTEATGRIYCLFFGLLSLLFLFYRFNFKQSYIYLMVFSFSVSSVIDSSSLLFLPLLILGIILINENRKQSYKDALIFAAFSLAIMAVFHLALYTIKYSSISLSGLFGFIFNKSPSKGLSFSKMFFTAWESLIANGNIHSDSIRLMFFPGNILELHRGFIVFFSALAGFIIISLVFLRKKVSFFHRKIIIWMLLFLFLPLPFFAYQEANALEYYIISLVPFWIIVAVVCYYLIKRFRVINYLLPVVLVVFVFNNFLFSIFPRTDARNSFYYPHYKYLKKDFNSQELTIVFTFDYIFSLNMRIIDSRLKTNIHKQAIFIDNYSKINDKYYEYLLKEVAAYDKVKIVFLLCSPVKSPDRIKVINDQINRYKYIYSDFIFDVVLLNRCPWISEYIGRYVDFQEFLLGIGNLGFKPLFMSEGPFEDIVSIEFRK